MTQDRIISSIRLLNKTLISEHALIHALGISREGRDLIQDQSADTIKCAVLVSGHFLQCFVIKELYDESLYLQTF